MSNTITARIKTRNGTTAQWAAMPSFVPLKGEQIVYLDYMADPDHAGQYIPGVKIGDGNAYLADLPFVYNTSAISAHMANSTIHVSSLDRISWDSNVSVEYDSTEEELIFE